MFDSLQQIARFGEIAAGPPVQFGRTGRIAIRQPAKHRFTKQAMIAIMTVLPVCYIKEQARRIGGIKRRPRIIASRDRSTGGRRQFSKNRCIHDEIPDCLWLKVQYFLVKIFSELMSEFSRMYRRILFALFFLPVDVSGYQDPCCPISEERRVGKECVSTCGPWGWP